jgi:hypothetical protein
MMKKKVDTKLIKEDTSLYGLTDGVQRVYNVVRGLSKPANFEFIKGGK